jgi:hypothetical protein
VLFNWAYSYFTYKRGARLITGHRMSAGPGSLPPMPSLPPPPPGEQQPPPALPPAR